MKISPKCIVEKYIFFRGQIKYYERSFAYPSIIATNTKLSRSLFGGDDLERGLYHLNFVDDSKGCVRSLKRKYQINLLNHKFI